MSDSDQPLIEDIRLLGRILGDVIREQEGTQSYELVEKVRTLPVSFGRDDDHSADRALKTLLKGLSAAETVRVIRAFTCFSHLANLAEDRHQIRRRSEAERVDEAIAGSLGVALARIRKAGVTPAQVALGLARSYLSPVLTVHPTEVQRTSILDAERGIALLLTRRDEIRKLGQKVFGMIDAEWHRTSEALTLVTGAKKRLEDNAEMQRSVRHRFPYIDPLRHLQVELMRRFRAGEGGDRVQGGIHLSINGVAAGLRNTG